MGAEARSAAPPGSTVAANPGEGGRVVSPVRPRTQGSLGPPRRHVLGQGPLLTLRRAGEEGHCAAAWPPLSRAPLRAADCRPRPAHWLPGRRGRRPGGGSGRGRQGP